MKPLSLDYLFQKFSADYFRELATFGALSDETVMRLLHKGNLFVLNQGDELYSAGARVEEFYVVLSGSIELYHHYNKIPALTHCYDPGQQIGFVGMIALHGRKGTAVAKQLSYVLSISTQQFFELHQHSPEEFGLLMLNLSREMARTIGELGDLIAELKAQ